MIMMREVPTTPRPMGKVVTTRPLPASTTAINWLLADREQTLVLPVEGEAGWLSTGLQRPRLLT
jgi:hypothetical protein